MTEHSEDDPITAAEERRAAEEALIAERNRAQHESEADGSAERVLLLPPEGYAVPPSEGEVRRRPPGLEQER